MAEYVMTVGLEVHIELKTETKIFCSCPVEFGAPPNSNICPVCMGLPGALPSLNRRVVEYAIKAGSALNCSINKLSFMDRKNYFYPDLPKAYQISQYDTPLCENGHLDVECDGKNVRIGITRIHIEEDAGKLIHTEGGETLIDCNRCGTPLIEIVSDPDIHSSEEAKAYLKALRAVILTTGISDCRMNEGSMRCDVNISVAPEDSPIRGQRTEIKNINSFSFVGKAIEAEYRRQIEVLKCGGTIERETRRYNASTGKTESMRSKESVEDYRFFREPDIIPIHVSAEEIGKLKSSIPPLPAERKKLYVEEINLPEYDAALLSSDITLSDIFDSSAKLTEHKKALANLLLGEILRLCDSEEFYCPIPAKSLAELSDMFGNGDINSSTQKKLVARLWDDPTLSPRHIAESESLWQIKDEERLLPLVLEAIEKNQRSAVDYKNGKTNALKALVGYVMGKTGGLAEPKTVEKLLLERIK